MTAVDHLLPPGARVNARYTIVRKLGAGGFATVFEAHDAQMDRGVAVKVLHALGMADDATREAFIKRFEREGKLAARIQHPGVINVFDYGIIETHQLPYIVMELLDGEDLGDLLAREGAMEAARLLPLFISALEALGYAHEEGIVHRDLKPSNLFLRYPGERRESLCVVDFGIAHLQDMSTRLTQTGSVMGTPAYVAPEYATEQHVSPALDVYQMGLILVEALSAQPVVQAPDSLVAMFQHVHGNLSVPTPLLDSPLGPILQRALAWDHTERYADGFAFADALKALDPATIPIAPEGAPTAPLRDHPSRESSGVSRAISAADPRAPTRLIEPAPAEARSNVMLIAAGAAVLVCILAAGALVSHLTRRPAADAHHTTGAPVAALTSPTPTPHHTTDAPATTGTAAPATTGATADQAHHAQTTAPAPELPPEPAPPEPAPPEPAPPKPTTATTPKPPPKPKPKPKPKPRRHTRRKPPRPTPWDRSTMGIFKAIDQHRAQLEACMAPQRMVLQIQLQIDEDGAPTLARVVGGGTNVNDRKCAEKVLRKIKFAPDDRRTGHYVPFGINRHL